MQQTFNTLYRIHTESTGALRQTAIDLVAREFTSFNVTDNKGHWLTVAEDSITIEIYGDGSISFRERIERVAEDIRAANNQDAVLVASFETFAHLLVRGK